MARILCAFSGIDFKCEHFPIFLTSRESYHPIFDVPQKRLWKYYKKWETGELTETDSYLLFLAFLNSTGLIKWHTTVKRTINTNSIVSNNMENLITIIGKIGGIAHPRFSVPSFSINPDTADLNNIRGWISVWNDCYDDFCNGLKDQELKESLNKKESVLQRLIKNNAIDPVKYAHILAAWASEAGQFPQFQLTINGIETTCCDYWKDIIRKCYRLEQIISIPVKDLKELTEHCEDNIEAGSIYSFQLFEALHTATKKLESFYSVGSLELLSSTNPGFRILDTETSVEDANLQVMIDTAPAEKPRRIDYPSDFAYLKAKFKYEAAMLYSKKEGKDTL